MPKAKEILEFDVRFDYKYPSFESTIEATNKNLAVRVNELTPFGAKFVIRNLTDEDQMISDDKNSLLISGRVMHDANEVKVEREVVDAGFDANDTVEFANDWVQDKWNAELLAEWAAQRMSVEKQEVNLTIVGNPLIEVADIITIRHGELSLNGEKRYVVYGVGQAWDAGLVTTIKAYEI